MLAHGRQSMVCLILSVCLHQEHRIYCVCLHAPCISRRSTGLSRLAGQPLRHALAAAASHPIPQCAQLARHDSSLPARRQASSSHTLSLPASRPASLTAMHMKPRPHIPTRTHPTPKKERHKGGNRARPPPPQCTYYVLRRPDRLLATWQRHTHAVARGISPLSSTLPKLVQFGISSVAAVGCSRTVSAGPIISSIILPCMWVADERVSVLVSARKCSEPRNTACPPPPPSP